MQQAATFARTLHCNNNNPHTYQVINVHSLPITQLALQLFGRCPDTTCTLSMHHARLLA